MWPQYLVLSAVMCSATSGVVPLANTAEHGEVDINGRGYALHALCALASAA